MKRIALLVMVMVCAVGLFAQAQTVSGTITAGDTRETLPQVNIIVQGTDVGTVSDFDGNFSLEVPDGKDTLIFKYVGYEDQVVSLSALDERSGIKVTLKSTNVGLNTVVVSASKRKERVLDAPASVTVINSDKITSGAPLTVVDNLKNTPGVDIMPTGLVQSNVNIRGFNNIFSGAMLTIVDNRIARVPSLRVNAYQLIPTNTYDIERMEVVRGPGSALYGPNATDGVLAIFTKSPLDMEEDYETTVSMSAGSRSLIKPEVRHAGKVSDKFGYKISASYMQGQDFKFFDPREPTFGDTIILGTVQDGNPFQTDSILVVDSLGDSSTVVDPDRISTFERDFFIRNYSADARFDIRPNDDIDIILSGGFATLNNIELTGLGAGQGINWRSYYGQVRFRYKDLFIQYFLNGSNAGDTYLIPQVGRNAPGPHEFQLLVDKSKQHVAQVQHNWSPVKNRLDLTYGVDMLLTTPETDGTINGRFENDDNILQVGGYVQAEATATEKLKFVAALRADGHSRVEGIFFSPRAAMVFKPAPRHNLRLTYNRAFSSPTSLNLFLDLSNGLIPNGINIRGIGNQNGFDYRYGDNGFAQFIAPSTGNWYDVGGPSSDNHVFFDDMVSIIGAGLAAQAGLPAATVNSIVGDLFNGITGENGNIQAADLLTVDYVKLLETGSIEQSLWDTRNFSRREAVKNSVTQTMEFGYKGILFDKIFLTADLYYTRIQDYVSPLTNVSASVIFDPESLIEAIGAPAPGNPLYDNIEASPFKDLLNTFLDGNPDYRDPNGVIPSVEGTVADELAVIILGASRQIPVGSVTPDNELVGADVILPYVNLGDIDIAGFDLGMTYQFTEAFSAQVAYSFVNKDRIPLTGAQGGFVALNAPRNKTATTLEYNLKKIGLVARASWRWQDGFPANSAVYIGDVRPANFLDLNVSYKAWFNRDLVFTVDATNVLNNMHQRFPGTPLIGAIVIGKVAYTF